MLERLLAAERVVITSHIRPDGDALGSMIGLGLFLRKLGKHVSLISSDPPPANLDWMNDLAEITRFTGALKQLKRVTEADTLIVVDTGAIERIGDFGEPFKNASGEKLIIDHHPNPETWFDLGLVRDKAAAVGEIIYELIEAHDVNLIDEPIAAALYTAIMTDTGSFRYNSTTPRIHQIIAELLERGNLNPEPMHVATYDTRTLNSLRLVARALDTITPVYDGKLAYILVTLGMMESTGGNSDEIDGLTSYPLSLQGVEAAVLFLETSKGIKCSFRSKGEVAINGWARKFGGGGHRNAAGAYVKNRPLREVIDEVIAAAPKYLDLGDEYEVKDELSQDDLSLLASFQGKL